MSGASLETVAKASGASVQPAMGVSLKCQLFLTSVMNLKL